MYQTGDAAASPSEQISIVMIAMLAGSRSSRSTTPNISFRFFPLDELCLSGFDLQFTFR
jgi:hypothetical protein